jgi:hypothetical protein
MLLIIWFILVILDYKFVFLGFEEFDFDLGKNMMWIINMLAYHFCTFTISLIIWLMIGLPIDILISKHKNEIKISIIKWINYYFNNYSNWIDFKIQYFKNRKFSINYIIIFLIIIIIIIIF